MPTRRPCQSRPGFQDFPRRRSLHFHYRHRMKVVLMQPSEERASRAAARQEALASGEQRYQMSLPDQATEARRLGAEKAQWAPA